MGFLSRLGGVFRALSTAPVDPSRAGGFFPVGGIPAGMRLSDAEATSVSAVWACIQAITNPLASSPWLVYQVQGRRRTYLPDDRLAYILNQRANPEITAIAFREAMMFGALASGNSYAEIVRDNAQRIIGLYPLEPDRMVLARNKDSGALVYRYTDQDGIVVSLSPADVFHLRGPVSVVGLMGDSIVSRAAKSIALAAAAERFSLAYLANGTIPSGVLTYPTKLAPEAKDIIRSQWREKMTGPKKGGAIVVLEGGMRYEQVSADPDKAQLSTTQNWTVEQIARAFGVPGVKIGVAASSQGYGRNIAELNQEWKTSCLTPWGRRFEQEANTKLLSEKPYRETTIDMGWLTRGNAVDQATADKLRLESGIFSVNELREEIGENTIGSEGDIRFVSASVQPLTTTLLDIQELAAKEPEPKQFPPALDVTQPKQLPAAEQEQDDSEDVSAFAQAIIGACLERYGSRIRARKRHVEPGHTPEQVEAMLAEERAKLAPKVTGEVVAALRLSGKTAVPNGTLTTACMSVEAGADPGVVAAQFWSTT